MRIIWSFIFFTTLINIQIFANDYNSYEMETVLNVPVSDNQVNMKFNFKAHDYQGPTGFGFDEAGNMYIGDPISSRIIIYSKDFTYQESLYSNYSEVLDVGAPEIVKNFFITGFGGHRVIIDLDLNKVHSEIEIYYSAYKDQLEDIEDFIYYDNTIFSYLKDNSLIAIPNPVVSPEENNQKILGPEETMELLKTKYADQIELTESNDILINGELQTRNFLRFFNYWNTIYDGDRSKLSEYDFFLGRRSASQVRFIGIDKNGFWYWDFGQESIVVYNTVGKLIHYFDYNPRNSRTRPAVHPNGDVYFLNYDEDGVYINKISRRW